MGNSSKGSKVVKWVLIGVSFLFIAIMLILPLITVLTEAFKDGIKVIHMLIRMFKLYKPKKYFNIIAAGLGVISTGFLIPVLYSYYQTGIVERFPTLIVCGFTYIIMILNICMGTILENRRDTDKKQMELKITEVTN